MVRARQYRRSQDSNLPRFCCRLAQVRRCFDQRRRQRSRWQGGPVSLHNLHAACIFWSSHIWYDTVLVTRRMHSQPSHPSALSNDSDRATELYQGMESQCSNLHLLKSSGQVLFLGVVVLMILIDWIMLLFYAPLVRRNLEHREHFP